MLTKIIYIFIAFFITISHVYSHDFNEATFGYILSNPQSTLSEFEAHVATGDDEELKLEMQDPETRIYTIISLPGKRYLSDYVVENLDFSFEDIDTLISDDPMLSELGSDVLYNFLSARLQSDEIQDIVTTETTQIPATNTSISTALLVLQQGILHILGGIDHILFIIMLVVCLPKTRRILLIVTTFTIAHSITILLGGLNIVTLSGNIVEPMILLSIIAMAIWAMFQKTGEEKKLIPEIAIIFGLGLFHGLGFAGFFHEIIANSNNIIIPVLAFNIGVELGQVLIIAIMLCVLYTLYQKFPKQKEYIKNILCVLAILTTLYWLVLMFL